jgi:microcystin-dependent protein
MNLSSLIPQPEKIPTGAVLPFAANSVPAGWLAANGAELLKTTYATLFAAIGITYGQTNGAGGAGTTHFRAPDLRGYFVRGSGTNSDLTASGTFGAKQVGSFQSHTHTATASSAGAHTHTHTDNYKLGNSNQQTGSGSWTGSNSDRTLNTSSAGAHTHTVTVTATGGTETRPDNIAMLYCIKF